MKKKSFLLIAMLVLSLALTACSPEATEYLAETKKVQSWEALEQEGTIEMTMKLPDELLALFADQDDESAEELNAEHKITVDFKAFSNNDPKNLTAKMTMSMKDDSQLLDIKDMEILIDKNYVYMPKEYLAMTLSLTEDDLNEIPANVKYFTLPTGYEDEELAKLIQLTSTGEYEKILTEIATILELDVPVKKDGNTYTIELNADQALDLLEKGLLNFMTKTDEVVKSAEAFKPLGITDEELKEIVADIKENSAEYEEEVKSAIKEIKPIIKDSSLKTTQTFGDDKYEAMMDMKINMSGFVNTAMKMDIKSKKAAVQTIKFPAKSDTMDYAEFLESITPHFGSTEIDLANKIIVDYTEDDMDKWDKEIAIKDFDGVEMYGFRRVFEALGFEVGYNAETDQPYYVLDGEKVFLDLPEVDGTAYISADKMEELGIEAYYHEDTAFLSLTYWGVEEFNFDEEVLEDVE